jgi:hypothetical protein
MKERKKEQRHDLGPQTGKHRHRKPNIASWTPRQTNIDMLEYKESDILTKVFRATHSGEIRLTQIPIL